MGYIEQTDVGNVYITDVNDWFATLSNLNRECKNYTDSEIRYKEILAEHDKQIKTEVINDFCKEYKNFQSDEGICDLQEDCSFSGGWCIDCFKEKWLKENK